MGSIQGKPIPKDQINLRKALRKWGFFFCVLFWYFFRDNKHQLDVFFEKLENVLTSLPLTPNNPTHAPNTSPPSSPVSTLNLPPSSSCPSQIENLPPNNTVPSTTPNDPLPPLGQSRMQESQMVQLTEPVDDVSFDESQMEAESDTEPEETVPDPLQGFKGLIFPSEGFHVVNPISGLQLHYCYGLHNLAPKLQSPAPKPSYLFLSKFVATKKRKIRLAIMTILAYSAFCQTSDKGPIVVVLLTHSGGVLTLLFHQNLGWQGLCIVFGKVLSLS